MTQKQLIKQWRRDARYFEKRSIKTYRNLYSGKLPQEDDYIYSAYEDQARADAYNECAQFLEETLKKISK